MISGLICAFASLFYGPSQDALVLANLRSCPSWLESEKLLHAKDKPIIEHLSALKGFEPAVIRRTVDYFLKENPPSSLKYLDSRATAVILNRLYFEVPSDLKCRDIEALQYFNQPIGGERLVLWPLGYVDDKLTIVGRYEGTAPYPYFYLEEFDLFARTFKRRK